VQFSKPDDYAVLLKPLACVPFPVAYAAFQVLNLRALLAFLWLFRHRLELKWIALISIPLAISFANGQDVPLFLFLFALSVWLQRKGFPLAAGICFSLCTIKIHFLIFVPLVILFSRRWRMIAGGLIGLGSLTVVGALFEGWDWWLRYPEYFRRPIIHPDVVQFLNLRRIAMALGSNETVRLLTLSAITIVPICFALWMTRKRDFEESLALALLGGTLVSYHMGFQDGSLLLLVFALAKRGSILAQGT